MSASDPFDVDERFHGGGRVRGVLCREAELGGANDTVVDQEATMDADLDALCTAVLHGCRPAAEKLSNAPPSQVLPTRVLRLALPLLLWLPTPRDLRPGRRPARTHAPLAQA
jgi:hypothetical protein